MERLNSLLEMLAAEPEDLFLNYALAMEYIAMKQLPQAEQQLKKTLGLNPEYVPCFYQLGQIYEGMGQNDAAIAAYKSGIEKAEQQTNKKALGELKEALWMLEDDD